MEYLIFLIVIVIIVSDLTYGSDTTSYSGY